MALNPTPCGVIHRNSAGDIINLPMSDLVVNALVVDVSARITLNQVFYNPSASPTQRAKYVFPLPARSAVAAFEMRCGDKRIYGVAKEHLLAKKEYETAVDEGKLATLVELATDDLFTISLGSVPSEGTLKTTLTFIMYLMTSDYVDQIRLQLPMSVGQRYGRIPDGIVDAHTVDSRTRVRIKVNIQTKGDLRQVTSPTHPTVILTPLRSHRSRSSRHRITAEYSSPEYLTRDFVLQVKADDLDKPRCFVDCDPKDPRSVAMQLTLVPKFDMFPQSIPRQEYIFLLDRSGSMSDHNRMSIAKRTLVMILHLLPRNGTSFNVFAFDHEIDQFFVTSQPYKENSLRTATARVEKVEPRGGTEIRAAIERALQKRSRSIPTAIFVLTDGLLYQMDFSFIAEAVAKAPDTAGIRIFTLGIGDGASSAMCEDIARAGKGVCLMATDAEEILPKCTKLVRAGRTFVLRNISIDWGVPADAVTPDGQSSAVRFAGHDAVLRQAPSFIDAIYPGNRFVVFALINLDNFAVPEFITLQAQRDGANSLELVKIPIRVEQVKSTDEETSIPLTHTMAARRLITDLQDNPNLPDEEKKGLITRLGEQYQLASRYTSFIAVDDRENESIAGQRRSTSSITNFQSHRGQDRSIRRGKKSKVVIPPALDTAVVGVGTFVMLALEYTSSFVTAVVDLFVGPYQSPSTAGSTPTTTRSMPDQYRPDTPDSFADGGALPGPDSSASDVGTESDRTFTTISSLESRSDSDWSTDDDGRPSSVFLDQIIRSPSPQFNEPVAGDGTIVDAPQGRAAARRAPPIPQVSDTVYNLVKLQSFDGSFTPDGKLRAIVGQAAMNDAVRPVHVDKQMWATALAVAYFENHLTEQPELLESLVEKIMEYVASNRMSVLPGGVVFDFRSVVDQAKTLIG